MDGLLSVKCADRQRQHGQLFFTSIQDQLILLLGILIVLVCYLI